MELRQLRTFRTVAVLGSFNRAADVLGYAQSTVSEHIKALEVDLKVRLFKRAGRRITLTAEGETLLRYTQKMLSLEEEIETEISGHQEVRGLLSIRVPETVSTYHFPPILREFHRRFPGVRFSFNNCAYFSLPEELRSGIINLAFLITDTFRMAELETEKLLDIPLAMVTYPANPLVSGQSVYVSDLKNEPLLVPTNDCSYVQMLEKKLTEETVEPGLVLRMNSIEAIKQSVMAGTGLTVLPRIVVHKEITEGLLVELPWMSGTFQASLLMIWHKNMWLPPILKAFMDMVRESLAVT
jgi:DNA-binding transcriptional LysR family regulator